MPKSSVEDNRAIFRYNSHNSDLAELLASFSPLLRAQLLNIVTMNIQSKSPRRNINWKQISIIAIVLGVAAFQYIQSRRNADQPNVDKNGSTAQVLPNEIDLDSQLKKDGQSNQNKPQGQTSIPDLKFQPIQSSKTSDSSNKPYLSDGPKGDMLSPAGLVYKNRRGEHRTAHVLRHAKNDTSRPIHGVFDDGDPDDIFRLIDEAYKMIKSNSRQVSKEKPDANKSFRATYTIDMKRRIGYRGGRNGNRDGKPAAYKMKLIIDNKNQVITAYPL